MNVLYCGDENIQDGLLISILSLLKNVSEPLRIYVMTMNLHTEKKDYHAISNHAIAFLNQLVKQKDVTNFVKRIDCTEMFQAQLPLANMDTRFTPFAMLRLYADELPEIPDRLLYLDSDVVCHRDCSAFYHQAIENTEMVGVLDYYGRWFFHRSLTHLDYLNSGVLLLNMKLIKQTKLFVKARKMCQEKWMFMPDQSALNKLSKTKRIVDRKYNEQHKLHADTVFQHFTTSFRFFPWLHTQTIKPWQVDQVHEKLKLHEYDDLLAEYQKLAPQLER
ncbi:MAG TPA: glycosyltransferase family 8 protein [Candidatus Ligilactobacillus excrementigallinarum]|uniref:Glycosyltransferase family 8 protein n=1 Tax=Candidatus Ligilactobacillus excrementigallinarum TaxID=2838641 RepID=A0A9D1UVQ4_9LACO|nr:glycosyltransferase family 8 protein [Candidatus Ligilactobacillus excrementigallinarum]